MSIRMWACLSCVLGGQSREKKIITLLLCLLLYFLFFLNINLGGGEWISLIEFCFVLRRVYKNDEGGKRVRFLLQDVSTGEPPPFSFVYLKKKFYLERRWRHPSHVIFKKGVIHSCCCCMGWRCVYECAHTHTHTRFSFPSSPTPPFYTIFFFFFFCG